MIQDVSIVIPTFNRANFLDRAVNSALAQTVKCEVVVCDHGSSDNTPQLMDKYVGQLTYIRRATDLGPHFCWLDGVMNATGKYVHINYDDDWIAPNFIEETLQMFNDDVGWVFTACKVIYEGTRPSLSEDLFIGRFRHGLNRSGAIENYLLGKGHVISPSCALFRKQDLLNSLFVGKIPGARNVYKGVGPDILSTLMPLLEYPHVGFVDKPLAFFLAHDSSITIDAGKDKLKRRAIDRAYTEARKFYFILKMCRSFDLPGILLFFRSLFFDLPRRLYNKYHQLRKGKS